MTNRVRKKTAIPVFIQLTKEGKIKKGKMTILPLLKLLQPTLHKGNMDISAHLKFPAGSLLLPALPFAPNAPSQLSPHAAHVILVPKLLTHATASSNHQLHHPSLQFLSQSKGSLCFNATPTWIVLLHMPPSQKQVQHPPSDLTP